MDVVIIGGGHNGLTAAFYLARAGFKAVVLEQREEIGGGAATSEIHAGFRCPTFAHDGSIRADIAQEMQLARHGLELLATEVDTYAPAATGAPAIVFRDERKTAGALSMLHPEDAEAFVAYHAALTDVCGVLAPLLTAPPPGVEAPDARDLWNLLKVGRRLRGIGAENEYRLLRWAPMPIADFAAEWFASDVLRALVAAPGVSGTMLGPRSAGSTLVALLREATRLLSGHAGQPRGGPGAVTRAMAAAARGAGVEIRTGVPVEQILVDGDSVVGVVAAGRELRARCVVSAIDPKTTFLKLLDPAYVSPDFISNVRNYRARGTVAKVNLALTELPRFPSPLTSMSELGGAFLSSRIHLGPDLDYLERAFDHTKYGEMSKEPWLDVRIPSVLDDSLCPRGSHVMSVYVHYAPYHLRQGDWSIERDALLKRTLSVLDRFAPGIERLILAAQTITPADLEMELGVHGGHYFHGELALDQLFVMRPFLGHARYDTPLSGLYVCGAGTHPGGFMSGGSGKLAAQEVADTLKRKRRD